MMPLKKILPISVLLLFLAACQRLAPPEPELPTQVADQARQITAQQLDLDLDLVTLVSGEAVDWSNACLGVTLPDHFCAEVVTPGYRFILEAAGTRFQVHSDREGSQVILAKAPGQASSLGLEWRRDGGIAGLCDGLQVYMTGDVFVQDCRQTQQAQGRLTTEQLALLYNWANRFEAFEIREGDPAVADAMFITLAFHGAGNGRADQSTQAAMADLVDELFSALGPAGVSTPQPIQASGTVSGRVCYPSEFIPAMEAFFENTASGETVTLPISEGQDRYRLDLPVGPYRAYAWRSDAEIGGGYTMYVQCGYFNTCTDHSLLAFEVRTGETTGGIDLCDWPLSGLPIEPQGELPGTPQLAGLVFSSPDGLWQVNPQGEPRLIFERPEAQPSPGGQQVIFSQEDDLWWADLLSGQKRNLTNTPERIEYLTRWWPGHPDRLIFNSFPVDTEVGPGFSGYLTAINSDGSGYQVLDIEHMAGSPALSPDGETVAYGQGQTGWLYRWEALPEAFDPAAYGLPQVQGLGSPAWSPDGRRLAWVVAGVLDGSDQFAVAVFDLQARQGRYLHPHPLPGMGGWPPAPAWSPDGRWLAYQAFDIDPQQSGLWVLPAEGGPGEVHLGRGGAPAWSPDGRWLAFTDAGGQLTLAAVGDWQPQAIDLPTAHGQPVTWLP